MTTKITGVKRKIEEIEVSALKNNKKQKKEIESLHDYLDFNEWISASKTRNWYLKDPILDWFSLYGKDKGYISDTQQPEYKSEFNFNEYITSKGIEFEEKILQLIKNKFGESNVCRISEDDKRESTSFDAFNRTVQAIADQVPIITHAVLHNHKNKTFGCPDLLVREDYINKLINTKVNLDENIGMKIGKNKTSYRYHYRIIDIKFTTLHLLADSINLSNSQSNPVYKSQLAVYNQALGVIQGYIPDSAYILGRRWKCDSKGTSGNSCFDKLGTVNFKLRDSKYILENEKAFRWIREVRKNGKIWNAYEPHRLEMFPNMSNTRDAPWHNAKKKIAEEIKEITLIWNCGPKHREFAYNLGRSSWLECNIQSLGINAESRNASVISKILEINQQEVFYDEYGAIYENIVSPEVIEIKSPEFLEFFVDFETVNDVNDSFRNLPNASGENMIYMIGCGYVDPYTSQWKFRNFVINKLIQSEELRITREWLEFMAEVKKELEWDIYEPELYTEPMIFHWSHAEVSFLSAAAERVAEINEYLLVYPKLNWFDLRDFFQKQGIVVQGCFNYKLKSIAKAMYQHGLIDTFWENSCIDGLGATVAAFKCNEENLNFRENLVMKEIEKYNQTDCKVLFEILSYLRDYHTKSEISEISE